MPELTNVVAVDWRAGADRCYFFFKDSNQYSRFDICDNKVPDGYPATITDSNWHGFYPYFKHLRFGFTTTGIRPVYSGISGVDSDILWLFYYHDDVPMVCRYDQDTDKVHSVDRLEDSTWRKLSPYFDQIIAGTWWQNNRDVQLFRFLLNGGHSLYLDLPTQKLTREAISETSWPGLERYKHRIITAVQNDRSFTDSCYYIFLTNNEYIRYNIPKNEIEAGPIKVDDVSWPGLLRN
ncbi:hypothetical protein [Pseudomonas frederiksbergensis]|uniref:hypothetical protein n=1 Tax=Pseudomonas frederiksbergensis TaxID=104087 RepID=UPI000F47F2EB|nr:hypothetical protein [Pseudomonas frederiksbergensis]RON50820.1 hypothetical protein BK667_18475 [Pseudomonas frederiksbergensis]